MEIVIGFVLGAFGGFFMVKSMMETRLQKIFVKMGFEGDALRQLCEYYKNFNKYEREAKQKLKDDIMKLELDYQSKKVEKNKRL